MARYTCAISLLFHLFLYLATFGFDVFSQYPGRGGGAILPAPSKKRQKSFTLHLVQN